MLATWCAQASSIGFKKIWWRGNQRYEKIERKSTFLKTMEIPLYISWTCVFLNIDIWFFWTLQIIVFDWGFFHDKKTSAVQTILISLMGFLKKWLLEPLKLKNSQKDQCSTSSSIDGSHCHWKDKSSHHSLEDIGISFHRLLNILTMLCLE